MTLTIRSAGYRLRRIIRLSSAGAVVASAAWGMTVTGVANASPLTSAPQFWSPHGAESLLLTETDVATITRTPGIRVTGATGQFADSSDRVNPMRCVVAFQSAERKAYPDAISATTIVMDDGRRGSDPTRLVAQSIVGFADETAAKKAFDTATEEWTRCGARTVNVKNLSGRPVPWQLGAPTTRGDGVVLAAANRSPDQNCERAMALRKADIVDVRVCALADGETATQAETITAIVSGDVAIKRTR